MAKKYVTRFRGDNFFSNDNSPSVRLNVKEEPLSPTEDFTDYANFDFNKSFENGIEKTMKKSLSMSDINSIKGDLHRRTTTEQPQCLSRTKFVSMAEAIYHLQRNTPDRFHSTRPAVFHSQGYIGRATLTVPQSPILLCKQRSRPYQILSQKEKEELEFEDIKKHKITPNPVPKSVMEAPHLPEVSKKPMTIPEPFNSTEVHKKIQSPVPVVKFKAREAPKHILEKPHIPAKPPIHVTKPMSPTFHYKPSEKCVQVNHKQKKEDVKLANKPVQRLGPVHPEPFSFEKRHEETKRKKEEKIRRVIEKEHEEASQFKARPVPEPIKKIMMKVTSKTCSSTSSENKENCVKFEAKKPVVLYKKPFKPVLKQTENIKPCPFALTTEKRAAEREKFDKNIKEKEMEQERLRQQQEKESKEIEEKERAILRATLVHHPQPVPSDAPFVPQKSEIPLTVPETPKFVRRLK